MLLILTFSYYQKIRTAFVFSYPIPFHFFESYFIANYLKWSPTANRCVTHFIFNFLCLSFAYTPIPLYPYAPSVHGVIAEGEGVRGTAIRRRSPLLSFAILVFFLKNIELWYNIKTQKNLLYIKSGIRKMVLPQSSKLKLGVRFPYTA